MRDLERYLTTEPEDIFSPWVEQVVDALSDSFYEANEEWVNEPSGKFNKWCNKLFDFDLTPENAAEIVEYAMLPDKVVDVMIETQNRIHWMLVKESPFMQLIRPSIH